MQGILDGIKEIFVFLTTPPYVFFMGLGIGLMLLGFIFRLIKGVVVDTGIKSVVTCFAILFLYLIALIAWGTDAYFQVFISALPFVDKINDGVELYGYMQHSFWGFLTEASHLFFLAFVVNILQSLLQPLTDTTGKPGIRGFLWWYFCQCLIVAVALLINRYAISWIKSKIAETAAVWIPNVLLILLTILMVLVALRLIFKSTGFLYRYSGVVDYLFDTMVGQAIVGAFLTTVILAVFVFAAQKLGWIQTIAEAGVLVEAVAPTIVILFVVWYIVWLLFM